MGEYAEISGERVKIGTCEDMYYLRFDQRHQVRALHGNVNPVKDAPELRFRFPWPDEDVTEPGAFEKYHRSLAVYGFTSTGSFEHHAVQFVAQAGYNVCLPCPESNAAQPFAIHRNGFAGAVQLVQQRFIPSIGLVPVLMCGGCGAKYRLEDRHEIEALAVAIRTEGDKRDREERLARDFHDRKDGPHQWAPMPSVFYHTIADRVLAGIAERIAA